MLRAVLFGTFRLAVDRMTVHLPTAKVQELAAYLLWHADERIPRQRLRSILWTDCSEKRASANLRQSIYLLRGALDDAGVAGILKLGGSEVRFLRAGYDLEVDALDFRDLANGRACNCENLEALTTAVSMYGGPLLADVDSEWATVARRRMQELFLETVKKTIACLDGAGLHESAIPHCRRWLDIEPTNEEAHRTIMRLHASSGYPGWGTHAVRGVPGASRRRAWGDAESGNPAVVRADRASSRRCLQAGRGIQERGVPQPKSFRGPLR